MNVSLGECLTFEFGVIIYVLFLEGQSIVFLKYILWENKFIVSNFINNYVSKIAIFDF